MRRVILSLFTALQAICFIAAVCGSNLSTSTSMDCCKKGQMDHMRMNDSKSHSCCNQCDMGKKSVAKLQKGIQRDLRIAQTSVGIPNKLDFHFVADYSDNTRWHDKTFVGPSPPRFILHDQLLI